MNSPTSIDEIWRVIEGEEDRLSADRKALWELIRVYPVYLTFLDSRQPRISYWLVGSIGEWALFYDDAEEQFAVSKYNDQGILSHLRTGGGDLSDALDTIIYPYRDAFRAQQ